MGSDAINQHGPNDCAPSITVDGPSGVGKGTISAKLATRLGWHLLDSGSIYRALALKVIQTGVDSSDLARMVALAQALDLQFEMQPEAPTRVRLDGIDVNDRLRTEECGDVASKIAALPAIRAALLQRQKDFARAPGLVADGRDMGTVVFKNANLKLFLTASAAERAKRRHKQLKNQGVDVNIADLLADIEARDFRDKNRSASPLIPAADAVLIDTSELSVDRVFDVAWDCVKKAGLIDP